MNIEQAIARVIDSMRERSPYKSGNLRFNAIKYEKMSDSHFRVYVDEEVAPYMCYTNEKWINRVGTNPNEGWWEDALANFANELVTLIKGEIKNG